MDTNELLNPISKDKMYKNGTKEEIMLDIFLAVVDHCRAEQNRERKSSDAFDANEVIGGKLSHQEVLNAASTILKYVSDMDQPYAQQLEGILANFGHQALLEEFKSL